jgi:hypothetical protein
MHKTDELKIYDLLTEIKDELMRAKTSVDWHASGTEEAFLQGINEGLNRAWDIVHGFDIHEYLSNEVSK